MRLACACVRTAQSIAGCVSAQHRLAMYAIPETQEETALEHRKNGTHREREVVEHLCAVPPSVGVAILSLALVIEAVHLHARRHCVLEQIA